VKRGDVWTVAGGKDYAGKPRPVVVIQDNSFEDLDSVTLCGLTTAPTEDVLFRVSIEPTPDNGLRLRSWLMVDKITTVPTSKLGQHVGQLSSNDILRLNRAIFVFLGLAASSKTDRNSP